MSDMKQNKFYFIVGSQHLYGPEALQAVDADAKAMVDGLNADASIPCELVFLPCVKTSAEIADVMNKANNDHACAGVVCWMHTFSPSKMWIKGLSMLQKPYLHLNTQFNRDIPWSTIDMDFMNLNQSAHGDREHGYITARLNLPRKVIVGHWENADFRSEIGTWMRAAVGYKESMSLRCLRISDNMRSVAVTDGDKVEAQYRLGWEIEHYGVGDIIAYVDQVNESEIDAQIEEYNKYYTFATDNMDAVRYQAREEIAIKRFMDERGFTAFHTNFEDLQALRQLPGLASQDLMRQGYGFGAEGDWKVAAMTRVLKVMGSDMSGGTAFMEDYTYHFEPGNEMIMGAHMLEVCPTIAQTRPEIQVHPLGIGGREDPARLVFKSKPGSAIVVSLVDMGSHLRMIVNDIECVEQTNEMPKLPVSGVLWKPMPNLKTSAEAWIYAGGAHHSVLSYDVTADMMRDFAEMAGIEFVHINKDTKIADFRKELQFNSVIFGRG